jgi:hypothetical protein
MPTAPNAMHNLPRMCRLRRVLVAALAVLVLAPSTVRGADGFDPPVDREFIADVDGSTERYVELRPVGFDPQATVDVIIALHGRDSLVPPDSVRRLAQKQADRRHKHVLLIDDAEGGHATSYEDTVTALEFVIRSADAVAASR